MQIGIKWMFAATIAVILPAVFIYSGAGSYSGPGCRNALYKSLPDDLYARHFLAGQARYFTRGALHCESEQAIKEYHDYTNADNIMGLARLIITGDCEYAKDERTAVVIIALKGMFVQVRGRDAEGARLWIPAMELAYEGQ